MLPHLFLKSFSDIILRSPPPVSDNEDFDYRKRLEDTVKGRLQLFESRQWEKLIREAVEEAPGPGFHEDKFEQPEEGDDLIFGARSKAKKDTYDKVLRTNQNGEVQSAVRMMRSSGVHEPTEDTKTKVAAKFMTMKTEEEKEKEKDKNIKKRSLDEILTIPKNSTTDCRSRSAEPQHQQGSKPCRLEMGPLQALLEGQEHALPHSWLEQCLVRRKD